MLDAGSDAACVSSEVGLVVCRSQNRSSGRRLLRAIRSRFGRNRSRSNWQIGKFIDSCPFDGKTTSMLGSRTSGPY